LCIAGNYRWIVTVDYSFDFVGLIIAVECFECDAVLLLKLGYASLPL
jgi:hypothetical protein